MVVFTCNHCGDSLQKPKVEKHIAVECRKKPMNPSLCCVDCLKDFDGQSYNKHTKCVTELERYSGKGFVPKQSSNKGERKQQSWIEVIQAVLEQPHLTAAQQSLLKALSNYPNVPRKQQKFKNFIQSSLRHLKSPFNVIEEVFNLIETQYKSTQSNATDNKEVKKDNSAESDKQVKVENAQNASTLDETPADTEAKKKKKKKNKSKGSDISTEPQPETVVPITPQLESTTPQDESGSFEVVKKKKKSKKTDNVVAENEENEKNESEKIERNENRKRSFGNNFEDDIPSKDISKKKQKKLKLQEAPEPSSNDSSAADKVDAPIIATESELNGTIDEKTEGSEAVKEEDNLQKLSKKERKELKKKLKYEAELKAIESEVNQPDSEKSPNNDQENDVQNNTGEKSTKKGKKRKRKLTESNENEETTVKKSKTSENEPLNQDIEQVNGSTKFSWEEVIRNVLEQAEGNEISLKKLTKKAVAEYQACYSDQKTYEEVLKKFNKKITKLPFVKILKDKAKLCA